MDDLSENLIKAFNAGKRRGYNVIREVAGVSYLQSNT